MRKVALLYSSGVESSSLLVHYLEGGYLVYPLYVRSGLPWEKTELDWATRLWTFLKAKYRNLLPVKVLFVRGLNAHGEGVEIPLRNLILTTSVAVESLKKGIRRIAIGSLGIYPFPDNNREYFDRLESLISEGAKERVSIETPFMGMEKWEIVKKYSSKVPYHLTFSCVKPEKGVHCGRCEKCLERREGFLKAGVPDPTLYFSS